MSVLGRIFGLLLHVAKLMPPGVIASPAGISPSPIFPDVSGKFGLILCMHMMS